MVARILKGLEEVLREANGTHRNRRPWMSSIGGKALCGRASQHVTIFSVQFHRTGSRREGREREACRCGASSCLRPLFTRQAWRGRRVRLSTANHQSHRTSPMPPCKPSSAWDDGPFRCIEVIMMLEKTRCLESSPKWMLVARLALDAALTPFVPRFETTR
jgi:hypothetical protein